MQQMSNTGFCSFLSLLLSSKLKKFFGKTAWCCCLWMPLESFHNFYSQTNAHMYVRSYKYIIVQRKLCRGLAEANNCCLLLFGFSLCYLLNSSAKEKSLLLHLHCARPRPPNAAGIIWHLIGSCIAAWKSREMRENSARTAHLSSSSLSALKSRLLLNFRLLFFFGALYRVTFPGCGHGYGGHKPICISLWCFFFLSAVGDLFTSIFFLPARL